MKKHTLFIVFLVVVGLAIGIWRDKQLSPKQVASTTTTNLQVGTALPQPKKLPEFKLIDMNGNTFTSERLLNRWSFVFFGYTNCPKLCPMTLAQLNQLSSRISRANVQFLFITIDPLNDTPLKLKEFLSTNNYTRNPLLGLTGEKKEIINLTNIMGVHAAQETQNAVSKEHIEHGGAVLLINPEGKLAAVFTSSDKPNIMAADFKNILHHYGRT